MFFEINKFPPTEAFASQTVAWLHLGANAKHKILLVEIGSKNGCHEPSNCLPTLVFEKSRWDLRQWESRNSKNVNAQTHFHEEACP